MKILIVTSEIGTSGGGLSLSCHRLVEELSKKIEVEEEKGGKCFLAALATLFLSLKLRLERAKIDLSFMELGP